MNNTNRKKAVRILIGITVGVITFLSSFFYLLSWNSSYSVKKPKVSAELVDKIRTAQKNGGVVELNNDEVNELIGMYFKQEKSIGNFNIKGTHAEVVNNNIRFYVPFSIKGFNFLVTSEGGLNFNNNRIEYQCTYIKIGKIGLPRDYVFKRLQGLLGKTITIENNNVFLDKQSIPINIKSIEIKDSKVMMNINKSGSLEENLKSINNNVNKVISSGSQNSNGDQNSNTSSSSTSLSKADSNALNGSKSTAEMDVALDRISSGLNAAMGSVSTGGQKAVISEMISVASSMKGNPNTNPYNYASSVRNVYYSLSPKERAELKSAVFSNVNGNDVNIVSKMLSK